jgi:hypothetical protein
MGRHVVQDLSGRRRDSGPVVVDSAGEAFETLPTPIEQVSVGRHNRRLRPRPEAGGAVHSLWITPKQICLAKRRLWKD